ncbi:MAG: glycoside hydrolase family 18 protein [Mycoplasmatales bacterium]
MLKIGYLKEKNGFNEEDENLKKLDIIIISFAKIKNMNGFVELELKDKNKLTSFIFNNPQIKFMLAIGGWGAGNFSESVESIENRSNFIASSMKIVDELGINGIDLDWEYPCVPGGGISAHPNDKFNFTHLMREIREVMNEKEKLNGKKYYLSFAAGAVKNMVENLELNSLYKIVDFMNLMTYDMTGSYTTTGHQTSIFPSLLTNQKGGAFFVDNFIENGFAADKINYGCAFYGRGASGVKSTSTGLCERIYGDEGLFIDYDAIVELVNSGEYVEYFDEKAIASYVYNGDSFYTYDSPRTLIEKIKYVKEKKLCGIMFWECATDKSGKLLQTLIEENYES